MFNKIFREWKVTIIVPSKKINESFENFDEITAHVCFTDLSKRLFQEKIKGRVYLYWRVSFGPFKGKWNLIHTTNTAND